MKEGNKPTSNARIMPEARGEASQDFITLSKASELSRVETEMVSFHSGYTDCLRNQCQNLRLLTLVLNFSCNYNDVSFCQQALTLKSLQCSLHSAEIDLCTYFLLIYYNLKSTNQQKQKWIIGKRVTLHSDRPPSL